MIGNLYVSSHDGLNIKVLSINLREEEVLDAICYYYPSIEKYEKLPLIGSLTLYQIKVPEEKEPIHCYFSTNNMEKAVEDIRYFEDTT